MDQNRQREQISRIAMKEMKNNIIHDALVKGVLFKYVRIDVSNFNIIVSINFQ